MIADEFRQMSEAEMTAKEKEMKEQLFRLRFQLASGQMESVKKLRELRKDMARLMTVRRQQELKAKHG